MSSKSGRRPGDPQRTKQAVLSAARKTFAAKGFDRSTMRAIASEADVDPSLLIHYFGDKVGLFVAAHELPGSPAELFEPIAALPVARRGLATARMYLQLFTKADSIPLSIVKAAMSETEAAELFRGFIEGQIIPAGLTILENPDDRGELRVTLLASHLIGVAIARQTLEISALSEAEVDELAKLIAPSVQLYING